MKRVVSSLLRQGLQLTRGQHLQACRWMSSQVDVTHAADATSHRREPAEASNLMDIGIRRIFNQDHDIFRQSVRRFFNEEVKPHEDKFLEQGFVDREIWLKAGKQGLLGVNAPAELGGIGGDFLSAAVVMEEQVYINDYYCGFPMHSDIAMPYIYRFGNQKMLEKYMPRLMDGSCITGIAMSEPAAGSDLQGIKTNAKQDGDDWILNGSKVFITNGYMGNAFVVVANTEPTAKPAHGISLFLVDDTFKGFTKGKMLKKIGMKAQDTAELFFEDVRLPKEQLVGEVNKGFYYLMQELPQERLLVAAMSMANCEFIFEETRKYVKERKAFGRTISSLQTIQHRLAELKTEICCTRAFLDQCLQIHQERGLDSDSASMAKYWATDLHNRVATQCLQMFGGWGYMWEFPVARAFVNARAQSIYGGSNEIMKELICRNIVKG